MKAYALHRPPAKGGVLISNLCAHVIGTLRCRCLLSPLFASFFAPFRHVPGCSSVHDGHDLNHEPIRLLTLELRHILYLVASDDGARGICSRRAIVLFPYLTLGLYACCASTNRHHEGQ